MVRSSVRMEAVRMGDWVGDVKEGGSVNFYNVFFNPHGHGISYRVCGAYFKKERVRQ